MPGYLIDLNARLVPRDRTVWRLFPGENYTFLPVFERESLVFLDLPGLALPAGALLPTTPMLDARILAARKIRVWSREAMLAARWGRTDVPAAPPRDPAAYIDRALPRDAHAEKGSSLALYGRAKAGDLVVVPDTIPMRRVLIGEFIDGPGSRETVRLPDIYGIEEIPARKVRWLARINELGLPSDLSDVLRRPNTMTLLGTNFYEAIFEKAYGTYISESSYAARIATTSEIFTGSDNLDLSLLVRLAAVLVSALELGDTRSITKLSEVIDRTVVPQQDLELSININSPGDFILKATGIAPLVFAALFALLAEATATELPDPATVRVINSGAAGQTDDCTPAIDARVRQALNLMQLEVWRQACERRRRLGTGPQAHGDSRATQQTLPGSGARGNSP